MPHFAQLFRLMHISWMLLRYGLDEIVLASHLFRPFRYLRWMLPWLWLKQHKTPPSVRIRLALEALGPIFVKFGQIMSTRRDLLSDELASELAKLQDQVPSFPGKLAKEIIEQSYAEELTSVFREFDETPFASASIAQVHHASLKDGTQVVVKVLRPGILKIIKRDLRLLYVIAHNVERFWSDGKRLRPLELVTELEKTLLNELDLMREAANAAQLRRNFDTSPLLYVPVVYWEYCRRNILVTERIHGIPISHIHELHKANIDLKKLAENGVTIFFTQVFRHSFFHADMHPGNIFVADNGQYIAVDFGIMGTLSAKDKRYLAENFLAFFRRDYRRVAELHIDSGWVAEGTHLEEFETAIRTVCEPIFDKPLQDISFGQLLIRLFQTAHRFNMQVQPQLVLLQKTLLNIEGLGRQLYPQLDLWQTAMPFLEKWVAEQVGPQMFFRQLVDNFPSWMEQMPRIPSLIHDVLDRAREGKLRYELSDKQMQTIQNEIRGTNRRVLHAIVGGSLIISASVIYALDGFTKFMLYGVPWMSWVLWLAGIAALVSVLTRDPD